MCVQFVLFFSIFDYEALFPTLLFFFTFTITIYHSSVATLSERLIVSYMLREHDEAGRARYIEEDGLCLH